MRRRALLSSDEKGYSKEYFTTVVTVGGYIYWATSNPLYYSKDNGETWTTANSTIDVVAGDKVLWKGTITPNAGGIGTFGNGSAQYSVEGNVMSLLYGDDFEEQTSLEGKDRAFRYLFLNNTKVISAENLSLPATVLAEYCYQDMFNGCTSLTTAPELPATTLAYQCYQRMFQGCTSLTTAPELPATTLASQCYDNMFNGCTNLSSIKCLATNVQQYNHTYNWVKGVAASGTFTKASSMTSWTTGTSGIPSGWTIVNA